MSECMRIVVGTAGTGTPGQDIFAMSTLAEGYRVWERRQTRGKCKKLALVIVYVCNPSKTIQALATDIVRRHVYSNKVGVRNAAVHTQTDEAFVLACPRNDALGLAQRIIKSNGVPLVLACTGYTESTTGEDVNKLIAYCRESAEYARGTVAVF